MFTLTLAVVMILHQIDHAVTKNKRFYYGEEESMPGILFKTFYDNGESLTPMLCSVSLIIALCFDMMIFLAIYIEIKNG